MKMGKTFVLVCLTVAALLMALPSAQAEDQKIMKVGSVWPFAGGVGVWARAYTDALILIADQINAEGGLLLDGEKYKIEIVEAEDHFTPEGAAAATRRVLEQDKVEWIQGGLATHTNVAMNEIVYPAQKLLLCLGSNKECIDQAQGNTKYSFRSWIPYSETVPGLLRWLSKTHPEIKRIALIEANLSSCWAGHRLVEEFAPTVGFEVVYSDFYEFGTTDYYPFLVKILETKPDVIYSVSGLAQLEALLIKQGRELGYKGYFLAGTTPDMVVMEPIAGIKNLEGFIGVGYPTSGPAFSDKAKEWIASFEKRFTSNIQFALVNAAPISVFFQAYQAAGTRDVEAVITQLESGKIWDTYVGYRGQFGLAKRYGHPHQWLTDQAVFQVQNGESVLVGLIPVADMSYDWKGKD